MNDFFASFSTPLIFFSVLYSDGVIIYNEFRNERGDVDTCPILWRKDKFECIESGCFWLSDTPEEFSFGWDAEYVEYRMCSYVVLKDKETKSKFVVMNTHVGFGDEEQIKSVELIHEYSEKISNYPTVVIGDFNMRPDSPAYERMTELFTDVNAVTANDLGPTYHGYNEEGNTPAHVDYCFVNKKVTPINQEIIDDLVDGEYPSDHYGLNIDVQF